MVVDVRGQFRQAGGGVDREGDEDYRDFTKIWRGPAPIGDGELRVVDGPPTSGVVPSLPEIPEEFAPGIAPEELAEIARRLRTSAGISGTQRR